ncbi:MAG: hypothetical protein HZA91_17255 [Verrucomicrobia bacterium]|nr:hypothetical protein [Verrucomicrobiota bacterium]
MNKHLLWVGGLAVLIIAAARPVTCQAETFTRAAELLGAGDHAGALAEAERALSTSPNDLMLLKIKAVAQMERGNPMAAARTLEGALRIQPDSVSCRYYLAQALAYAGELPSSLALCREVIARAPESEYAKMAAKIVPDLERLLRQKQTEGAAAAAVTSDAAAHVTKRWDILTRTAVEYDDNVPAHSEDGPGSPAKGSLRNVVSFAAEVRPLDQVMDHTPLTVGVCGSAYQSFHWRDALSEFDLTSLNGSVYLSRVGALPSLDWPYRVKVLGGYQHNRLDGDFFNNQIDAGASVDVQHCEHALTSLWFTQSWRAFEQDTATPRMFSRDGSGWSPGVAEHFYLWDNRLDLSVDYAYADWHTEGTQFDLQSHTVGLGARVALPCRFALAARGQFQTEDYTEFTPRPQRLDDVWTCSVSLSRPIWGERLVAELSYTRIESNSAQNFADYERNIFGIALSASF